MKTRLVLASAPLFLLACSPVRSTFPRMTTQQQQAPAGAAAGGHGTGNGGGFCSLEFVRLGHELADWLSTRPEVLEGSGTTLENFVNKVNTAHVDCTDQELKIGISPKDAKNFPGESLILVHQPSWDANDVVGKRAGIDFHEYLGLALGRDVSYEFSQKILGDSGFFNRPGVAGSSSYERELVHLDGSVTIVGPYFRRGKVKFPIYGVNGGIVWTENVCRRYGLGDYIDHEVDDQHSGEAIVIGEDGKELATRTYDERCVSPKFDNGQDCPNNVITSISCRPRRPVLSSAVPKLVDRAEKVDYDEDGNIIITRPFTYGPGAEKAYISARTMENMSTWRTGDPTEGEAKAMLKKEWSSICRYMGFWDALAIQVSKDLYPTFLIDRDSALFDGFRYQPSERVESITCHQN